MSYIPTAKQAAAYTKNRAIDDLFKGATARWKNKDHGTPPLAVNERSKESDWPSVYHRFYTSISESYVREQPAGTKALTLEFIRTSMNVYFKGTNKAVETNHERKVREAKESDDKDAAIKTRDAALARDEAAKKEKRDMLTSVKERATGFTLRLEELETSAIEPLHINAEDAIAAALPDKSTRAEELYNAILQLLRSDDVNSTYSDLTTEIALMTKQCEKLVADYATYIWASDILEDQAQKAEAARRSMPKGAEMNGKRGTKQKKDESEKKAGRTRPL
jgi:hypothetical protein